MKVKSLKPKPKFVPVVVTLESQEEVDKMFAVFNHRKINTIIGVPDWWELLAVYNSNDYEKYFDKLEEIIK